VLDEKTIFSLREKNIHTLSSGGENLSEIIGKTNPDLVFHLASLFLSNHRKDDIDALLDSNIVFGTKLAEAMTLNGVSSLVNTGTSWQHLKKSREYCPVNLYAATKQAYEDILEFYVEERNLKAITLKLFDTYGPGDRRKKIMPVLLAASRNPGHAPLQMTPGDNRLDFVYVEDVCRAFLTAGYRLMDGFVDSHERYDVSSGHSVSLKELVETFSNISGLPINAVWGARPYRERDIMTPCNTGEALPGWEPRIDLTCGIRSLLDCKNDNRETP